jgi:hypothetical protein
MCNTSSNGTATMATRTRLNITFISIFPLLSVNYDVDDLAHPYIYYSPLVTELYLPLRGSNLSSIPFRKYSLGLLNVLKLSIYVPFSSLDNKTSVGAAVGRCTVFVTQATESVIPTGCIKRF